MPKWNRDESFFERIVKWYIDTLQFDAINEFLQRARKPDVIEQGETAVKLAKDSLREMVDDAITELKFARKENAQLKQYNRNGLVKYCQRKRESVNEMKDHIIKTFLLFVPKSQDEIRNVSVKRYVGHKNSSFHHVLGG